MKTIAAGKFKDVCLKTLDDVAKTRTPVVITKRGRPVATLVPYLVPTTQRSLAGSVVREIGDPYGIGERWDADAS
jgi:antitoxin (DNA-binding transcriptional repressor) of toxin-antitoxin stability system